MMTTAAATKRPLIWCLEGPKAGDNAQLRAITDALSGLRAFELRTVPLDFAPQELLITLLLGVSTLGLTSSARARLVRPWPDLVLTAGRRNEPVARWIQRESMGRARLVHCGRPWANPLRYDLVVSTPQYYLDSQTYPNVLTLPLPPAPRRRATPDARQGPVLLLFGGESGNTQLGAAFAAALVSRAAGLARSRNRPLRIATSPRTSTAAEAAIAQQAQAEHAEHYLWNARAGAANPYANWISSASAAVVTADSMSMIADVAAIGLPVWIAKIPSSERPWWLTRRGWRWRSATHELAQIVAPRRFRRDTLRLLDALVTSGRALWLEDDIRAQAAINPDFGGETDDAERAAAAIADLLPR